MSKYCVQHNKASMRAMDAEMKLDRLAAALPSAPASVLLPGGGGGGNVSKLVYDGDVVEP